MLLRRVIKHVEDQNWLAIGIDFFIVVSGVFIGLQLGNWNDVRADKRAYEHAIERYIAESNTNLERLNATDTALQERLKEIATVIDILQNCDAKPDSKQIVETGLLRIIGTYGMSLQTSALDELTTSPILLAQQTDDMRQRFSDTKYRADVFLREASLIELIPLEEPIQNLSIVEIGQLENRELVYSGADYSRAQRNLKLTVPFEEACQNEELIKAFFTWERWQGALPAVSRILREDLEANLAALE